MIIENIYKPEFVEDIIDQKKLDLRKDEQSIIDIH